jgi:hypothetical protein
VRGVAIKGSIHLRRPTKWALLCGFLICTTAASAAVVQQGNVRITLLSQVMPHKLPRVGTAPIAVFVAGHVEAVHGGVPDQLQRLRIEVNRRALLQSRGLPVCRIPEVQPASTNRALAACGPALVGSGQFWASIVLPEQGSYRTQGRLLVFNGRQHGRPVLLAHIYTSNPFGSSFVIAFQIRRIDDGEYGTELTASLPQALGDWGYVDRIKLTLRRKYRWHGKELSYFNAACPALKGTDTAAFHLAFAEFSFAHAEVGVAVDKSCGVTE